MLTGQGCFSRYLHIVARRYLTLEYHHWSGYDENMAEHTLPYCPFAEQCRVLVSQIVPDLSLLTVVTTVLSSDVSWKAMLNFYESTISEKKATEREKESSSLFTLIRRRQAGAAKGFSPGTDPEPPFERPHR